MKFKGNTKEYLQLQTLESQDGNIFEEFIEGSLTILWFRSDSNELIIDGKEHVFTKNQLVFLTEFHRIKINNIEKYLIIQRRNIKNARRILICWIKDLSRKSQVPKHWKLPHH